MKTPYFFAVITVCFSVSLLEGCDSIANLQNEALTVKASDGSKVNVNTNLTPSLAWGCNEVGTAQRYNWAQAQMTEFNLKSPEMRLVDKGIRYLAMNELKANYINLLLPETKTFSFSKNPKVTTYYNRDLKNDAILVFYQCQKINPERKLGMKSESNLGLSIH